MKQLLSFQFLLISLCTFLGLYSSLFADGKIVRPRNYKGSLEEKAQEAIIIFKAGDKRGDAVEDLILKIRVEGDAKEFAWIIPFPNQPTIKKEKKELFGELFSYVEARKLRPKRGSKTDNKAKGGFGGDNEGVFEIAREVVGEFEIATVKETQAGALNPWLEKEGFQQLENAEDVIGFYRDKGYVFCCIKVSSEALENRDEIESHPLRFTFKTGGQDGIYFPMKMTGLQESKFDVNLYVFYRYWLNDKLNKFGYSKRGMELYYRDFDTKECVANGGKDYSDPESDPFLDDHAHRFDTVKKLFQKLHPGEKFYLTNIKAKNLDPEDVREWKDDLWMFPYYTNSRFMVPYDVRNNGPASAAWPNEKVSIESSQDSGAAESAISAVRWSWLSGVGAAAIALCIVFAVVFKQATGCCKQEVVEFGSTPDKG